MPPVGTNCTDGKGAARLRIPAGPPRCAAGNSLTSSTPVSSARMISPAVATPGRAGTSSARQRARTVSLRPGLTTKRAPASTARSTWSAVMTLPAPTSMSGSRAIARSASRAAGVRNVTSAQGSPPSARAAASGTAERGESTTTTGMTCRSRSSSRKVLIVTPPSCRPPPLRPAVGSDVVGPARPGRPRTRGRDLRAPRPGRRRTHPGRSGRGSPVGTAAAGRRHPEVPCRGAA